MCYTKNVDKINRTKTWNNILCKRLECLILKMGGPLHELCICWHKLEYR